MCGGVVACSTCHVYVTKGLDLAPEAIEEEEDQLDFALHFEMRVAWRVSVCRMAALMSRSRSPSGIVTRSLKSLTEEPEGPMPKTVLVTGANRGIGLEMADSLWSVVTA